MKKIRKNLSFMFALLFIVILNVSAQTYSWNTIYTPKGTGLQAGTLTGGDMSNSWKNYWKDYYLWYYQNRIVWEDVATFSYNCHGYAWWVTEGGSDLWIGRQYHDDDEDVFWEDHSYIEVPNQSWATKVSYGGPCVYYSPEWDATANWCDHSAITTGNTNWFTSKWGAMPLFSHSKDDCPYDDGDLHYYVRNNAHISGPSAVCPSSTEFSVEDLLPGATFSWSTSSNITRISSQGSNPCQFEANENGVTGWISATITYNNNQYNIGKSVWLGVPTEMPTIYPTGDPAIEATVGETVPVTVIVLPPGAIDYMTSWYAYGSLDVLNPTGQYGLFYCNDVADPTMFSVTTENECGISPEKFGYIYITEGENLKAENKGLLWSISPNPATEYIEINLGGIDVDNIKDGYRIDIIDYQSKTIKNVILYGLSNRINIQDLSSGQYVVRFTINKTVIHKTLIIN